MHGTSKATMLDVGNRREAGGDEAFHVAGAARIEPIILAAQRERVAGPGLAIDGDRIDMAGQRDAARFLRSDGRVQVRLRTGGILADPVCYAVLIEPRADEADQLQIRIAARGIERGQPGEHVRRADPIAGFWSVHVGQLIRVAAHGKRHAGRRPGDIL